jgi:AcrR family transcriptional regulator
MTLRTRHKRVTKEPDVRRRELMDASVQVFAEKGIARSTVADITRAAGVAKGTFYLYFTSKEHLLAGLKERFVDEILDHASGLYARVGQDDWEALLDATVESMTDFMIDRADMVQVMVQEGYAEDTIELYADCEAKVDEMFAAGIRAGVESGAFHINDPDMAGRMIHHALEGTLKDSILYRGGIDRERFVASAKEMVRKVLVPPGP